MSKTPKKRQPAPTIPEGLLPVSLGKGQPRLNHDIICRIAERRAKGLSLKHALAMERPIPLSLEHFTKQLKGRPNLLRILAAREGDYIARALDDLQLAGKGEWQKVAWRLERAFPDEYGRESGRPKAQNLTVNVGLAIGVEEQVRAQAAMRLVGNGKEKRSQPSNLKRKPKPVIDVQVVQSPEAPSEPAD